MRTQRSLSMCILACLLSTGGAASADDAMTDTARELFAKGVKAAEHQKWDQCRAVLLAALAIKPHPQVVANLASCEMKLGLYRDAAEHIAYFLRELPPNAPREKRTFAEAGLRDAQAKIETVRVTVNVEGADVRVDGKVVGRSPLPDPIFVLPGPHTFDASADGFPRASATVDAKAGGSRELALVLKKEEPAVVPPSPLVPVEKRPVWPAITAGGVALAALGAGVGLTLAATSKNTDVDRFGTTVGGSSACYGAGATATGCTSLLDALRSKNTLSDAAFVTYLVGGAAAAGAVALGIWAGLGPQGASVGERGPRTSLRVLPAANANGAGLSVVGTW